MPPTMKYIMFLLMAILAVAIATPIKRSDRTCANLWYTDKTSTGSPTFSDCYDLAVSIKNHGQIPIGCDSSMVTIATSGTCAFAASCDNNGYTDLFITGEDILDIMYMAMLEYQADLNGVTLIGSEGGTDCRAVDVNLVLTGPQGYILEPLRWQIYHT